MVDISFSFKTLKKLNRWLCSLYGASANLEMSKLSAIDRALDFKTVDLCLIPVQKQPICIP